MGLPESVEHGALRQGVRRACLEGALVTTRAGLFGARLGPMAGVAVARHRRPHPWWPAGHHRARPDPYALWVVPLAVAVGIGVLVFGLLMIGDLLTSR
jgi:hypothetical protein